MPLHTDIAPHSRRLVAGTVDCLAAIAIYWSLVKADLPLVEGDFIAAAITTLVAAVLASTRVLPAQSPGKWVSRLAVLPAEGGTLSFVQQALRDSTRPVLAFVLSFGFIIAGIATLELAFAVALASVAAAEALTTTLRRDARTCTDLLFHTRVVQLPPLQPYRAPAGPMYSATDAEFGQPPRQPPSDA